MILKDLIKRVYALLGEDESSDRITEATVKFSLNAGYREIIKNSRVIIGSISILAVNEQTEYSVPGYMHHILKVFYNGGELEKKSSYDLTAEFPGWRTAPTGTPAYFYRDDVRTIGLYPPPIVAESEELAVLLSGYVYPATANTALPLLNQDDDEPLIPDEFHEALAMYAVYDVSAIILSDDPGAQIRGQASLQRFSLAVQVLSAYIGGA